MRHGFKIVAVLAIGLVTQAVVAQAPAAQPQSAAVIPEDQQPSDTQLNRLMDVMRVKEQMATTSKMMPQLLQQEFERQVQEMQNTHPELAKMTPEQQQAFARVIGSFMEKAMNLYTGDEMMTDIKGIYKKHLTQPDVENLITFYNSPSGQHMLDMVPVIMQEFMPMVMHKTEERMKPMLVQMEKDLADVTKAPADGGKPGQPK